MPQDGRVARPKPAPAPQPTPAPAHWTPDQQAYIEAISQPSKEAQAAAGMQFAALIQSQYPTYGLLLNKIPELAGVFGEAAQAAVAGTPWSNEQFQAKLASTHWWQSTPESQRLWLAQQAYDPAKSAQQLGGRVGEIITQAGALGVNLNPTQIHDLADQAIGQGWSDQFLTQKIVGYSTQARDKPGTITATQTNLHSIAAQYGVPVSSPTTLQWAQRIVDGSATQDGFTEYAKDQAKLNHPYWHKQLDEGATVRQLADPYVQSAARLLEVSPERIDLTDPKWSFTNPAKDGQQQPMTQLEWSRHLMNDPTYGWDQTEGARQAAYGVVQNLRQSFGAV